MASAGGTMVKNLPANTRDPRNSGLTPGLGRCPAGGNGWTHSQFSTIRRERVPWSDFTNKFWQDSCSSLQSTQALHVQNSTCFEITKRDSSLTQSTEQGLNHQSEK